MTTRILAAAALLLFAFVVKFLWEGQKALNLPGPWYSRYTNLVLRFYTISGRRIFYVDELHKRYGGVVRVAPREVAVADLAGVTQIHKIGSGFLKSEFYEKLTPNADPGIFAMRNPHDHAARRKLFARAFSNSSIKANWEGEVRKKTETVVGKIKHDALEGSKGADVFKWWTLMTTDVIAHLSFGESFKMVEQGKQTPYIDAIQNALLAGVLRAELPWLYFIIAKIPNKKIQAFFGGEKVVYEYGAHAIQNMRSGNANSMNLFGQMLAAQDSGEKASLTDKAVREEASNLIIAGSDTTAVTLTYLVWAVLKHPELQVQLEAEVAELSDGLTLAELESSTILNSVIEETLRLYGAAPGALPRVVPGQGMTVNGHFIPAGTEVTTQAYTNHRDPDVFSNALQFDGLRFLNKTATTAQQKAALMPFGGGSRVCIGIHLAYMELRLGAAMFFRECRGARLSTSMRDEMMEMENQFLIAPKGHCCFVTLK